ncbi:unnamed protein product [Oikopleura dioica]|uniref:PH domain-containing protein n=1 Tax=Oikopleura dioica TaxID=34765 RepID=E4WY35_OIKDI|nr:unnamed protein product [Oikopleura dioica]
MIQKHRKTGKVGELPTISENITSTLKNKGTLEKFNERSSRNGDFERLGLTSGSFRVLNTAKMNSPFSLCKTYPGITVQLSSITDTTVQGAAKAFKRNRYPAIVWRHAKNGCVLARSEAISDRVIHRLLRRRRFDEIDEVGLANPTKDLENWIKAVVNVSEKSRRTNSEHQVSMLQRSSIYASVSSVSSSATLASSGIIGGLRDSIRIPTLQRSRAGSTLPSPKKASNQSSKMVIFVDKDTRKLKPEVEHQVEFLSIDTPSTDSIRDAFKDLCKNAPSSKNSFSFSENSRWYSYVLTALSCASAAADLMNHDSGWDFTSVLTGLGRILFESNFDIQFSHNKIDPGKALVELLLDPYYRTIDGFRTLVQREFISFGHRFSTNGIQRDYPSPSPFFILFLDCVSQLINQNLCSLEFTGAFLHLTGYHTFSGRFSTFLLDSEHDRIESLIMFDSSARSCFWSHVEEAIQNPKCPLINKFYLPNETEVLSMTAEMEFIKLFPYLSGCSTTSPHDMDNLLDELSLDVAEDKELRQNFVYSGVDNARNFFGADKKRMNSFDPQNVPAHVLSELEEKNKARVDQRVKTGTHFINRCRRLKVVDETDEGSPRPEQRRNNVYEGYLWKQGRQFRGWKCYYFAIVDNQSIEQYDQKGGSMTKEIPLNQITSADLVPIVDPRSLPRDTRPDFHFQLKMNSRKYSFVAQNAASALRWKYPKIIISVIFKKREFFIIISFKSGSEKSSSGKLRENSMTQQAKGPTWTRILTIVLYLIFASLPALSFAIFYSSLWTGTMNFERENEMSNSQLAMPMGGRLHSSL